ncbi:MAG: hypothetical protein R6V56_05460 [Lentisphaeria bacterium]
MNQSQQTLLKSVDTNLYPLLFEPVWQKSESGGDMLSDKYPDICSRAKTGNICWQIIDDGNLQSKVLNGAFAGKSLRHMVEDNPVELVGKRHRPQASFPLCCRILDLGKDQPLGVHPAGERRRDKRQAQSNTKFWYTLATKGSTRVYAGIAQRVTGQQLIRHIDDHSKMLGMVRSFPARPGDSFLIPPGFIHGIAAGNLVWELQENNVPAYRLSDAEENAEIPEEERQAALDAVIVESRHNPRISREASKFTHTRRIPLTRHCPFFLVDEVRLFDHTFMRTTSDSFHLLFMVKGTGIVEYGAAKLELIPGQVCCIPAALGEYKVKTAGAPAEFLRIRRPTLT